MTKSLKIGKIMPRQIIK